MYRLDWLEKPAGKAIRELIQKTWHTDASGETNAQGAFTTRGVLGDYAITVTIGEKQKSVTAKLPAQGRDVAVTLD